MCTGMNGARAALLSCNIILMLISLACIGGGVVLIIGKAIYGSQLDFLKEDLSVSAAAIRGTNNLDVSGLDVIFITLPLGVVLLISGVLILTMCILGIIAASGQFYKFIIVYCALLGSLYFSQIVVIICAYIDRDPFDSTVKSFLKASLDAYVGIDGEDSFTLGWNSVMSYQKCCGVDDYTDFLVAGYPRTVGATVIQAPQICCINAKTPGAAPSCASAGNLNTQTYYNKGCYNHMWDYVTTHSVIILLGVFGITLLEFLCLFFAVWIICRRKSEGVTKVGDYERYN